MNILHISQRDSRQVAEKESQAAVSTRNDAEVVARDDGGVESSANLVELTVNVEVPKWTAAETFSRYSESFNERWFELIYSDGRNLMVYKKHGSKRRTDINDRAYYCAIL